MESLAASMHAAKGAVDWTFARRERRFWVVAVIAGSAVAVSLWLFLRRNRRREGGEQSVARCSSGSSSNSVGSLISLNAHEKTVAAGFLDKDAEEVQSCGFDEIGGLDDQLRQLQELVIFPLTRPDLFRHSRVATQPSGILLYGPPGTGKTLLAKAIAKEVRASFLTVNVSTLQSKWYGESPKLVDALFSLARKRSPCVMFIDEIDGFLTTRHELDSAHVNTVKTKFMENWDGLSHLAAGAAAGAGTGGATSLPPSWVLVIAATNKPYALDPAVLRRLPRQIRVDLPAAAARAAILRVMLRHERADVPAAGLASVAAATEGFSGSDLRELVRAAAMGPIREAMAAERAAAAAQQLQEPRPLRAGDLLAATAEVQPNGAVARAYRAELQQVALLPPAAAAPRGTALVATPAARYAASGHVYAQAPAPSSSAASSVGSVPSVTPRGSSPGEATDGAAGGKTKGPAVATSAAASVESVARGPQSPLVVQAILEFGPSARLNSRALTSAIEQQSQAHAAATTAM